MRKVYLLVSLLFVLLLSACAGTHTQNLHEWNERGVQYIPLSELGAEEFSGWRIDRTLIGGSNELASVDICIKNDRIFEAHHCDLKNQEVELVRLDLYRTSIHLLAGPPTEGSELVRKAGGFDADQSAWECFSGLGSNSDRDEQGYNICASRYSGDATDGVNRAFGSLNYVFATHRTIRTIDVEKLVGDLIRLDAFDRAGEILATFVAQGDISGLTFNEESIGRLKHVLQSSPYVLNSGHKMDDFEGSLAKFDQQIVRRKGDEARAEASARARAQSEARQWRAANASNATSTDIGRLVCRFGTLHYRSNTGLSALGHSHFTDHQQEGYISAFIESFSPERNRLQLRVNGFGTQSGRTDAPAHTHPSIGGLSSEPGRIFWDESKNWYFCDQVPS